MSRTSGVSVSAISVTSIDDEDDEHDDDDDNHDDRDDNFPPINIRFLDGTGGSHHFLDGPTGSWKISL